MSLVTICPSCDKTLRVSPKQLSAHRGDVRCGQCQHVFNALEQLDVVSSEESIPLMTEKQTEKVTHITQVDFEIEFPETPSVAEPEPEPETVIPPVESTSTVSSDNTNTPQADTMAKEVDSERFDFSQPKPLFSGKLLMLLLLLLIASLITASYFMRTEIASYYPPLRPWMERACGMLGCTVGLPQKAELLSIEDSDLQDNDGTLLLLSVLYNRAPYPQAFPLIELTLTDVYDMPLMKRTLTPKDYLPADTDIASGIPANGEVRSRLPLIVEGEKPAGYRLYVKY